MDLKEYSKIKNYSYLEYCDYLQKKYGLSTEDYMFDTWVKNKKCTRTDEGLVVHHKFEDHAIMLSTPDFARNNPFDWQKAKNLIYCDYLEHLFLHILICENPAKDRNKQEAVGIGGVINFIVPELNDYYSGWKTKQAWRDKCLSKVRNDKNVYFELLKRFKKNCSNYPFYTDKCLFTSFNAKYKLWDPKNNIPLFRMIKNL